MQINGRQYRSLWFEDASLYMIDQNKIPHEFVIVKYDNYQDVVKAIKDMTVRGAPAIGAAGAYGMALAALNASEDSFRKSMRQARKELISARPTAIDLASGVNAVYETVLKFIPDIPHTRQLALLSAEEFTNKIVKECEELSQAGNEIIPDGARILTHCNAGALATVDHGTALGVIRAAHHSGKKLFVYVDETRPRLQGARLTAFELAQEGIPHAIIADAAAGFYFYKREIDVVITGADRICLNGDIANKIGTYEKAVLADAHGVPFYIAAPLSTFDFSCVQGTDIPIEIRDEMEVLKLNDCYMANPGSPGLNPAFDITPAQYITGIITPKGIFSPAEAAKRVQA